MAEKGGVYSFIQTVTMTTRRGGWEATVGEEESQMIHPHRKMRRPRGSYRKIKDCLICISTCKEREQEKEEVERLLMIKLIF